MRACLLLLLLTMATGCAANLAMADVRDPEQPAATIRYTAVRAGAQQFAEYNTIDGSILASDSPGASPGDAPGDSPSPGDAPGEDR